MGLHLCPIEPDDWANGPNGPNEACEKCGGSGVFMLKGVLPVPCECTEQADNYPEYDG